MKLFEIVSIFSYKLAYLIPKKKNLWVFGAWFGKSVSDNPAALCDYVVRNNPEIEVVWITNDMKTCSERGWRAIKRNSLGSLKYILTAQVVVMNQGFGDVNAVNLLGGCYKVQLWHGIAWKKIVGDALPDANKKIDKIYQKFFFYINKYDLYIAPSEKYAMTVQSAFHVNKKNILFVGQPRNVILFNKERCNEIHRELLNKLGEVDKKIIVYMPTFRDKKSFGFTFYDDKIVDQLRGLADKYNFILIEKSHFEDSRNKNINDLRNEFVFMMPNEPADSLLAAADILITDYSSCFFDYLIRDKPIIHYVYDYEYYKNNDRGLYYNLDDVAAGSIANDTNELIDAIKDNLIDPLKERIKRERVKGIMLNFENENNIKTIVNKIIKEVDKK